MFRINNPVYKIIDIDWSDITPPLKEGSPMALDGTISNDGDAIGLVTQYVIKTPNTNSVRLLVGGDVDLEEVEAAFGDELEDACKAALDGIRFHLADGSVFASGLPAVTEDDAGKVLMVDEDGAWVAGAEGLAVNIIETETPGLYELNKTYLDITTALKSGITPTFVQEQVQDGMTLYIVHACVGFGEFTMPGTSNYVYMITTTDIENSTNYGFMADSEDGVLTGHVQQ